MLVATTAPPQQAQGALQQGHQRIALLRHAHHRDRPRHPPVTHALQQQQAANTRRRSSPAAGPAVACLMQAQRLLLTPVVAATTAKQPPSSANRLLSSYKQAGGQPPAWRPLMRSSACQKDDVACRADGDAPAAGFERFAFTGPSPQSGVLQALNLKQEGTLLNIQWKQALLQLLDVIKGSSLLWAACLGCFCCQMSVVQAY